MPPPPLQSEVEGSLQPRDAVPTQGEDYQSIVVRCPGGAAGRRIALLDPPRFVGPSWRQGEDPGQFRP